MHKHVWYKQYTSWKPAAATILAAGSFYIKKKISELDNFNAKNDNVKKGFFKIAKN